LETWRIVAGQSVIEDLAQHNAVVWIEPAGEPVLLGEREALAVAGVFDESGECVEPGIAYQDWLNQVNLSGNGVIVQLIDRGISPGNSSGAPGTLPPDLLGRVIHILSQTQEPMDNDVTGHGTLNASIIAGRPLAGGGLRGPDRYLLGQGVAPGALLYGTKV